MACSWNWNPLGEQTFYRRSELYSMAWDLAEELRDCLVAAAPYGGPIALLKNNSRKEKSPGSRPVLEIYSAAGLPLASIVWKSGQVVQLGWTASEDLLCIQEDGSVLMYNLFCEFKRRFSMGNEVLQNHVLEARVFHTEYGTGVAILTGAHRISLATNIDDLKLRRMHDMPSLQKPPSCWAVLFQDRVTVILLATGQELYLLDDTSCNMMVGQERWDELLGCQEHGSPILWKKRFCRLKLQRSGVGRDLQGHIQSRTGLRQDQPCPNQPRQTPCLTLSNTAVTPDKAPSITSTPASGKAEGL